MRRLVGALVIALMVGSATARAEAVWTCEQDGRLGGRASALCVTDVEPGSYQVTIRGLTRESSGELRLTIGGVVQPTCTVLANLWSCEDGTQGAGQSEMWPAFTFDVAEPTEIQFRTYPPECGTVTCDREPQIIAGRFRLTLETI